MGTFPGCSGTGCGCVMRNKSDENWRAAHDCLKAGNLNAAASRFYYSVFQAVLLHAQKKRNYVSSGPKVHVDMLDLMEAEGKQTQRFYRVYKELKALRNKADYDTEHATREEIDELLGDGEKIRLWRLEHADK